MELPIDTHGYEIEQLLSESFLPICPLINLEQIWYLFKELHLKSSLNYFPHSIALIISRDNFPIFKHESNHHFFFVATIVVQLSILLTLL